MNKIAPDPRERRAFGRRPANIKAKARIGYRIETCYIKDLSEGGALLEFEEALDLPVRLWLSWPDQRAEIVCEIRHQRGQHVGVQFARPIAVAIRPTVLPEKAAVASLPKRAEPALPAAAPFARVQLRRLKAGV